MYLRLMVVSGCIYHLLTRLLNPVLLQCVTVHHGKVVTDRSNIVL